MLIILMIIQYINYQKAKEYYLNVLEIVEEDSEIFYQLGKTSNEIYSCQSLVIATGGLSIPTLGSTPFGYRIAEQFNIKVYPTRAGLVPFTLHNTDKSRLSPLSGISVYCQASVDNMTFEEND